MGNFCSKQTDDDSLDSESDELELHDFFKEDGTNPILYPKKENMREFKDDDITTEPEKESDNSSDENSSRDNLDLFEGEEGYEEDPILLKR